MRCHLTGCRSTMLMLAILAGVFCAPLQAATSPYAEIALGNVDNPGQAGSRYSAGFAEAAAGLDWAPGMQIGTGWGLSADLRTRRYQRYEDLSWLQAQAAGEAWLVLGRGFYAPTFWLNGALSWREYASERRDQQRAELALRLTQRASTALLFEAGLRFSTRDASARVFSGSSQSLELAAYWQPLPRWGGALQLTGSNGAFAAGTAAQNPNGWSGRWVTDDAVPDRWIYRRDGAGRAIALGLHWQATRRGQLWLDLAWQRWEPDAPASGTYKGRSAMLGWRYRR